jgi:hypothetical protein
MTSNLQVREQKPTYIEPDKQFQKEDMKRKAPASKARCCFFGCQEEAVIGDMCLWHHRYEHYESK